MAEGGTTQVAVAAGVAAATGAAQLGLGYGLGVVAWPAVVTADDSLWLGSLGWATWIAASSTVFGAVVASRFRARTGGPWRFALAASAAVGALLAVALIALPARFAVRPDTFSPETIAGGYAAIGVLFGLVIAYWAVVSRPVAANLIATAVWLWALAVAAVVVELTLHRASATYLSSWQFADPGAGSKYGTIYWPSSVLTLLAALVIGAIGALPAVRRGELTIGAAASGAVGPLLVAAAFFVLAPQLTGALGALESAYLIAPYAVLAGLSGSAIVVGLGQRSAERHREPRVLATERSRPRTATGVAAVPAQATPAKTTPAPASPRKAQDATPEAAPDAAKPKRRGFGRLRPGGKPEAEEAAPPAKTAPAAANPKPTAPQPAKSRPAAEPVTRSTVAAPPSSPPIVKINPSRSGDSAPPPPTPAKPAKAAKATPPRPAQPTKAQPTKAQPANTQPAKAQPAKAQPAKAQPPKAQPAKPDDQQNKA